MQVYQYKEIILKSQFQSEIEKQLKIDLNKPLELNIIDIRSLNLKEGEVDLFFSIENVIKELKIDLYGKQKVYILSPISCDLTCIPIITDTQQVLPKTFEIQDHSNEQFKQLTRLRKLLQVKVETGFVDHDNSNLRMFSHSKNTFKNLVDIEHFYERIMEIKG